ncbi:MAG: helix-turn-helix domain-containing protein [Fusicatenibacter sp.]|nr:helix-turn-helix domain-containing protein [Fusicatenibacter sp.]
MKNLCQESELPTEIFLWFLCRRIAGFFSNGECKNTDYHTADDPGRRFAEAAASVHLSPRECQRIFKAYLHRTPMEYLQWRRILAAADNLRNTNEFCPCRFWEQMV